MSDGASERKCTYEHFDTHTRREREKEIYSQVCIIFFKWQTTSSDFLVCFYSSKSSLRLYYILCTCASRVPRSNLFCIILHNSVFFLLEINDEKKTRAKHTQNQRHIIRAFIEIQINFCQLCRRKP